MTTLFDVHGPLEVPIHQGKGGRAITQEEVDSFWTINPSHASQKGCYVFGIRAGKGFTPGYVGKATKSFKQEIFTTHKLTKYHNFLVAYGKGTPVLFLLLYPAKKGKANTTQIGELERFLIQLGAAANPDILNIKGTKTEEWGIRGVIRAGKGKPSQAATKFKKMMDSS
jgi:hypothetical protein